jgi:hypothetical protein
MLSVYISVHFIYLSILLIGWLVPQASSAKISPSLDVLLARRCHLLLDT